MLWNILEALGGLLVVAFFAVLWWPSALLVAGLGLIVVALTHDLDTQPEQLGEPT